MENREKAAREMTKGDVAKAAICMPNERARRSSQTSQHGDKRTGIRDI